MILFKYWICSINHFTPIRLCTDPIVHRMIYLGNIFTFVWDRFIYSYAVDIYHFATTTVDQIYSWIKNKDIKHVQNETSLTELNVV